ncbi:DNA-binding CsgD family transcriptional regulator [Bacillus sp. SORGH_AS 510]|uniref:LuxR C-terminal-related transcriptional regulator n=1 Tax=Bacillus sp. SORGH_AS_0510 TaxID=3041771 RepID=UPI002785F350|nr:LuxR C-terminal-related transcriptional regulator [Bacillus sp. SORGH_AS_0510]MDQ1147437.1 DNA-binding CsgD family transcriptional regulator [Bacillus sp. SORGH_AS_0510]
MKHKIEQLLQKGLSLLLELKEPFMMEWRDMQTTLKYQNDHLVEEIETMIQIASEKVTTSKASNVDTFIHSILTEWQSRYSTQYNESESLSLVSSIENIFHKLLADKPTTTFLDHQAIQSFFSRMMDQALLTQSWEEQNKKWLKNIIATNIIPMKWVAVVKKEQELYQIESVVCADEYAVDSHLIDMCSNLKASQICHISLAIKKLIGTGEKETDIVQVSCLNDVLLVCLREPGMTVTEQQYDFIRGMYLRQLKLQQLESRMEWKDGSLLFLQHLLRARSVDDAVKAITKGLVDYMPFNRCALFLYNHYEDKGIGVSGYNVNIPSVQQIQEEILGLSLIENYLSSLTHSQPLYFLNATEVLPKKYVKEFQLRSLVVLPIFVPTKSKLLGIALLDQGEDSQFEISMQTLSTLIKFGHYAGELLYSIWDEALQQFGGTQSVLTVREKEVLQLIASGASINEAAEKLHLSSYTVRDYVSVIIQKLEAKNRTDAAVKALKMKLIS